MLSIFVTSLHGRGTPSMSWEMPYEPSPYATLPYSTCPMQIAVQWPFTNHSVTWKNGPDSAKSQRHTDQVHGEPQGFQSRVGVCQHLAKNLTLAKLCWLVNPPGQGRLEICKAGTKDTAGVESSVMELQDKSNEVRALTECYALLCVYKSG